MRNPLLIIDDAMFRVFQPIVDRFPNAGPPGVARFFITGAFVAGMASDVPRHAVFSAAIVALACAACYLTAGLSGARQGLKNPRYLTDRIWRIAQFVFGLIGLAGMLAEPTVENALIAAYPILLTAYWYAVACDVNPPRRKQSVWERRAVHA
ncbi:MAG: hypothetical protein BGO51_06530 [Rhodospirillales bacterium 69-11]|nr:hypothetical protein [Rhodospirillales bacterium]MBN8927439.1 hypothetical protein [Rhodospirillales bacterium]OJW26695.1 MAG: hypothetical protein BGO51_06530 [Rhodospirillales bacterium 69-11]